LAFRAGLVAIVLSVVVLLCDWYAALSRRVPGLAESIEYPDRYGERPPWLQVKLVVPEPWLKRDTRYMRFSDDLVFMCGRDGGFESEVAGNYDGAVSRRRGLSKEFALALAL
jgi:hypothetical protein